MSIQTVDGNDTKQCRSLLVLNSRFVARGGLLDGHIITTMYDFEPQILSLAS